MRLSTFLIIAGGPGSGRKPGFGQGHQPGSGRPFGVKLGIHKTLTEAGFKYKGAYTSVPGQGVSQHSVHTYQHPVSGHSIKVYNQDRWKHADKTGTGTPYGKANGIGATALKSHLTQYHNY